MPTQHFSATSQWKLRNAPAEQRGVATVEFAIVAPVLLILLIGVLDVGQLVNVSHTVSNASREGARTAARGTTTNVSAVKSVVSTYLHNSFPNVAPETLDAATQVNVKNSAGQSLAGDLSMLPAGEPISVEVIFGFQPVRWLRSITHFSSKTLNTTTIMRRE
jgi:Flp pilus assembly protein TadG